MTEGEIKAVETYFESLKFKFKFSSIELNCEMYGFSTTRVEGLLYNEDRKISGKVSFEFSGMGIPVEGNALPSPEVKKG